MSYNYPIKIVYIDTNERKVIKSPDEIEKFKLYIEEKELTWGRKVKACDIREEEWASVGTEYKVA